MQKIVVIGGGGHARVLISIIKKQSINVTLLGYTDRIDRSEISGVPYLGNDSILPQLKKQYPELNVIIGIGNTVSTEFRQELYNKIKAMDFSLPHLVSQDSIVDDDVNVGEGSFVSNGVVINTGAKIGRAAIINTSSIIEHDCVVHDYVHIAPGATLCGNVIIGENSFIGAGSVIANNIEVTKNCTVGEGSVVVENCLIEGLYFGVPARRIG